MDNVELNYEFSVQVTGLDFNNISQLLKLENDEITVVPFSTEGLVLIGVEVPATSPEQAWEKFKTFLNENAPEVTIVRIDFDLVSMSQIAERGIKTREAVRLWTKGKRREGFPVPFTSAGQSLLWSWAEVFNWLPKVELANKSIPMPLNMIERLNGMFASQRAGIDRGWSVVRTQRIPTYKTNLGPDVIKVIPIEKKRTQAIKYGEPLTAQANEVGVA